MNILPRNLTATLLDIFALGLPRVHASGIFPHPIGLFFPVRLLNGDCLAIGQSQLQLRRWP